MLTFVIAIVSLLTAFYFYYFPRNDKGIAYTVEGPSLIYDSKIASPAIRLVDGSNTPIKSDTYLETFTVWNTGSSAIEPVDIRRPVSFILQGSERILDSKIVNSTDPDVCEFKISNSQDGKPFSNVVFLTWKHFDPKKAVKFQVIYCQQTKPMTLVSADIVGVGKLQAGIKQKEWIKVFTSATYIWMICFLLFPILRDGVRSKHTLKWIPISLSILGIVGLSVAIWFMVSQTIFSPTPPL